VLRDRHGLADTRLDEVDLDQLDDSAGTGPAAVPGDPVLMNQGPMDRPLFLVHAVGGTVFGYARLAGQLDDAYRVYGLAAADPGVGPADLTGMVTAYVARVRAVQPAGPYRLGGWSMGGLIALEMARRFEQEGAEVEFVALLDAPSEPADLTGLSEQDAARQFVIDAARALGPDAIDPPGPDAAAGEQLGWLVEQLTKGAGDTAAARAEIERRFAVFREQLRIIAGYRPRPVTARTLLVAAEQSYDFAPHWRRVLGPELAVRRVPGDHYSFLQALGAHEVAAALRGCPDSGTRG